jgi:hypothetical protein
MLLTKRLHSLVDRVAAVMVQLLLPVALARQE